MNWGNFRKNMKISPFLLKKYNNNDTYRSNREYSNNRANYRE